MTVTIDITIEGAKKYLSCMDEEEITEILCHMLGVEEGDLELGFFYKDGE